MVSLITGIGIGKLYEYSDPIKKMFGQITFEYINHVKEEYEQFPTNTNKTSIQMNTCVSHLRTGSCRTICFHLHTCIHQTKKFLWYGV